MQMSFSAALDYLLAALRSGSGANQSVIFVLDEFDLFASHKNQSLLYNLLDISQSSHNPIAVVGLTCRLDVVELLEKRVKSRFSHRQLLLFPHSEFRDYVSLTRSLLSLPHNFKQRQFHREWQQNLEVLITSYPPCLSSPVFFLLCAFGCFFSQLSPQFPSLRVCGSFVFCTIA
jgi:origin recognition complex subunit 4